MTKSRNLLIVGDGTFAEVAFEYFTEDSDFEVVGFAVEREHLTKENLFDLPVVALDAAASRFPPEDHAAFVAITYNEMNRLRTRLVAEVKVLGYRLASFISSHAMVSKSARIGEHCFIFEACVVQPYSLIEDNVVVWSGSHIGHHATVEENCFLARATVSGFSTIGRNSFLGGNSTISNNITIGRDNWIGPGIVISKDTGPGELFGPVKTRPSKVGALDFFRVND